MGDKFIYSRENLKQIEFLLPRLKYSIMPTHLVRWLENFKTEEIPNAIDLLRVMEYISFPEFMNRLEVLLKELLKPIPIGEKILVFPYGKIGKSGTLVTYPFKNTPSFKKRSKDILMTQDLQFVKRPRQYKHIIFIDDFIGSGKTFCDEYISTGIEKWVYDNSVPNLYLLTAIIMHEGRVKISNLHPKIKIVAEERHKLFDTTHSPFHIFNSSKIDELKQMTLKYGNTISVGRPPYQFQPLGYDKSESLISFFHGTPNNTIPLIWGQCKEWNSLYARSAEVRMSEAKKIKKELNYYLSISDKLGINLHYGDALMKNLPDNRVLHIRELRNQNHAAITVLYLFSKGYENIFICQILGLSREELLLIYHELRNKNLISTTYKAITKEGNQILAKLSKVKKLSKNRNETKKNLELENILYLPQMFKGIN